MLLRFRSRSESVNSQADIESDVAEPDFIPAACHYNERTLLTKNGELMQVIRIWADLAGLAHEGAEITGVYLRDVIRRALLQHVPSEKYAFWFHTVRSKKPLPAMEKGDNAFAARLE